jgi:hypothetical protein
VPWRRNRSHGRGSCIVARSPPRSSPLRNVVTAHGAPSQDVPPPGNVRLRGSIETSQLTRAASAAASSPTWPTDSQDQTRSGRGPHHLRGPARLATILSSADYQSAGAACHCMNLGPAPRRLGSLRGAASLDAPSQEHIIDSRLQEWRRASAALRVAQIGLSLVAVGGPAAAGLWADSPLIPWLSFAATVASTALLQFAVAARASAFRGAWRLLYLAWVEAGSDFVAGDPAARKRVLSALLAGEALIAAAAPEDALPSRLQDTP